MFGSAFRNDLTDSSIEMGFASVLPSSIALLALGFVTAVNSERHTLLSYKFPPCLKAVLIRY
jgi:hypothetical protein